MNSQQSTDQASHPFAGQPFASQSFASQSFASWAGEPDPVDLQDDFFLDLDADAAIAACEALWNS